MKGALRRQYSLFLVTRVILAAGTIEVSTGFIGLES
jgi:hypothetical protein